MTEPGFRRAALRLSGMHPADRRWVLQQLPRHARQQLEMLIGELRTLGFEDPSVIAEALAAHAPEPGSRAGEDGTLRTQLSALSPAWTAAGLKLQPAVLRKSYLERLPEAKRRELASHSADELPGLLAASLKRRLRNSPAAEPGALAVTRIDAARKPAA